VQCIRGAYSLGADVWVDAQEFEERLNAGMAAERDGDDEVALAQIDLALELYRGDFIADEPYAEWAMMERERLHELAERALWNAMNIGERRHDLREALEYARHLGNMARYDTNVHRRLIRLCLSCGRRSEAGRRYAAFRARLSRDFGEEPDFGVADCWPQEGSPAVDSRQSARASSRPAAR
jgi:DNA-binding SARP family transcriptional activator